MRKEPRVEHCLLNLPALITGSLLLAAGGFVAFGFFGNGESAGIALVPAAILAYAALLPGTFLLLRSFPEKVLLTDPPTRTAVVVIWCRRNDQSRKKPGRQSPTVAEFIERRTRAPYPNRQGLHAVIWR